MNFILFIIFSARGYSNAFCRVRGFGKGPRYSTRRAGRVLRHLYSVNSRTREPDASLMHTLLSSMRYCKFFYPFAILIQNLF